MPDGCRLSLARVSGEGCGRWSCEALSDGLDEATDDASEYTESNVSLSPSEISLSVLLSPFLEPCCRYLSDGALSDILDEYSVVADVCVKIVFPLVGAGFAV